MKKECEHSKLSLNVLNEELINFESIACRLKPHPGEIPNIENIDIYGDTMELYGPIGGDHLIYVDFNKRFDLDARIKEAEQRGRKKVALQLEKNRKKAGILLADVAGHRITDALLAGMLHQAFLLGVGYELKYNGVVTPELFECINARFFHSSSIGKFITMIYGEISTAGTFRFLSAGHPLPIVFSNRFDKIVEISKDRLLSFPPIGTMLSGSDPDRNGFKTILGYKEHYTVNEINLMGHGDVIILATDGFWEHQNEREELFHELWLEKLLRQVKHKDSHSIFEKLKEAFFQFAIPHDDVSFVVIKRA